ncbi:hypothetical protein FNU76_17795 [Chitinimonas arctica]|uniref:Uncharacterized protein n=1 Tax=Chitinimonas arctica TaxID=2594795 RepID=A0A516SIS5_9NEIS|nr:hypothetical protein [Chitinimonas arctica]QDQ28047.1 hypothetical protein FNU76_17795 [Chitinimonas arctica]
MNCFRYIFSCFSSGSASSPTSEKQSASNFPHSVSKGDAKNNSKELDNDRTSASSRWRSFIQKLTCSGPRNSTPTDGACKDKLKFNIESDQDPKGRVPVRSEVKNKAPTLNPATAAGEKNKPVPRRNVSETTAVPQNGGDGIVHSVPKDVADISLEILQQCKVWSTHNFLPKREVEFYGVKFMRLVDTFVNSGLVHAFGIPEGQRNNYGHLVFHTIRFIPGGSPEFSMTVAYGTNTKPVQFELDGNGKLAISSDHAPALPLPG